MISKEQDHPKRSITISILETTWTFPILMELNLNLDMKSKRDKKDMESHITITQWTTEM